MNKEGLAADLVCLLDVRSREQDVAELKKLMEHYFISGAARIDLIAKVIDLDNDLGGLIFDIPLLETTEDALTTLTESTGRLVWIGWRRRGDGGGGSRSCHVQLFCLDQHLISPHNIIT